MPDEPGGRWPARQAAGTAARPGRRRGSRPRTADARARGEGGRSQARTASRQNVSRPGRTRLPRRRRPRAGTAAAGPAGRTRSRWPAAIDGLLDEQGWRTAAAVGSVFGRWAQIVGPDLAAHTRPDGFADGELLVIADSTAWATQVRLLAATLVRRLNTELGDGHRDQGQGPRSRHRPAQRGRVAGTRRARAT